MIQFVLIWQGNRVRFSTHQKALPDEWDAGRQRIRTRAANAIVRNQIIAKIESLIHQTYDPLALTHSMPGKAEVEGYCNLISQAAKDGTLLTATQLVRPVVEPILPPAVSPVRALHEQYIHEYRSRLAKSTLDMFRPPVDHLLSFAPDVVPEMVDLSFINDWMNYLSDDHGLADSSVVMYVNKLASLFRYGARKGYTLPVDIDDWPSSRLRSTRYWSTEEEIEQILSYPYAQKWARDTAICYGFACYTGLRVSDLARFDAAVHLRSGKMGNETFQYIDMQQQKTKEMVNIALSPYAIDLLERCGGRPWGDWGHQLNNTAYNLRIKKIGQQAGINSVVERVIYRKGRPEREQVAKYSVLSSHVARHSFACNSLLRGVPVQVLKEVMGHRSIESTMAYVHITDTYKHQQILSAWATPPAPAPAGTP
ncbi:site-specific recombinase XerD [Spirosoma oryzae]|uniref:Site-specific recombinase XerD n=2 Tax=Spirosoma oryzae TaxID=1469603 RepID=A0A2T0T5A1_9BACT|nr:site-specific recombinase XerD [Spirosoma oryzae]